MTRLLDKIDKPGANADVIVENANKKLADFQKIQTYRIWPEEDFPRSATKKVQKEKVYWVV